MKENPAERRKSNINSLLLKIKLYKYGDIHLKNPEEKMSQRQNSGSF